MAVSYRVPRKRPALLSLMNRTEHRISGPFCKQTRNRINTLDDEDGTIYVNEYCPRSYAVISRKNKFHSRADRGLCSSVAFIDDAVKDFPTPVLGRAVGP